MKSPGSTLKYPARAVMDLTPSFRLPARISESADSAMPASAATRAWGTPLDSMRYRSIGTPVTAGIG